MKSDSARIYQAGSVTTDHLVGQTIAVIGYGNQGRAQALNMRDSGLQVVIGNQDDRYRQRAIDDGFAVFSVSEAVPLAQVILLLVPDEVLPGVFEGSIRPNLNPDSVLVFASGYNVAYDLISLPEDSDVLLIAPRMIGVGVRERYLTKEGFFCFIGIEQDRSGDARPILLELIQAISGFHMPAIEVTFKQEAILDLFNEQAFGPAFGRVLLNSIQVLLDNGLPPEAVLVEMYMSEEMAYTYRKMAQVGLVRQTLFHSQTSQYGAMSRGVHFIGSGLKEKMERIYREIESGAFTRERNSPLSRLKFQAIRFFAMRQRINAIEKQVRKRLGMPEFNDSLAQENIDGILADPRLKEELAGFEDSFDF